MSGYLALLLGGLQGIILSAIIYSKRVHQPANLYLAILILLLGIGCIVDNNFLTVPDHVFVIIWTGNSFLFAPFLFLYTQRLIETFKFNRRLFITHFSIFLVMKSMVLLHLVINPDSEQLNLILGATLNLFLALFNVAYGAIICRNVLQHRKSLDGRQYKWTLTMTVFFISYSVLLLVRRIFTELTQWELAFADDYIYLGITLGIYWASFQIINQPDVITLGKQKYTKSTLSADDISEYGKRIEAYLRSSKVYTQSEFSFAGLSQNLNIPKHQLSQVIGVHFGKSFYELIADLRVQEVKRLLTSGEFDHLSILGVAMECGFLSKSSFNRAFKKVTGQTPQQFVKSL